MLLGVLRNPVLRLSAPATRSTLHACWAPNAARACRSMSTVPPSNNASRTAAKILSALPKSLSFRTPAPARLMHSTAPKSTAATASTTATATSATTTSTSTGTAASSESAAAAAEAALPILPSPAVGRWLLLSSVLVLAIIVVGGVTRLTESGLSITEWRPITGILPPLSHAEWMVEFDKYKATPEFKIMNQLITLDDFKAIFYMEWGHRVLGRLIGVAFLGPLIFFAARRQLPALLTVRLSALALLIGAQGALGWYMVQSGLEDALLDTPGAVPRVSQYRLAAHLGLAFLLYLGMFGTGMAVVKDLKFAAGRAWTGLTADAVQKVLANPALAAFRRQAWALTGLVFLTALSGAFVAGLDAGLLYNEFPLMGGRLAPPADELFSPEYAKNPDKSDIWWRNIFENPTTVQFDHRVLATTTYFATALLYARTFTPALRAALPPLTRMATMAAFAMVNVQAALGITTLLYLVPVPLAAAHQAGSVMLLSAMVHLLITMRRPGAAARAWRSFRAAKSPQAKP